jgi:hypothetical protein
VILEFEPLFVCVIFVDGTFYCLEILFKLNGVSILCLLQPMDGGVDSVPMHHQAAGDTATTEGFLSCQRMALRH